MQRVRMKMAAMMRRTPTARMRMGFEATKYTFNFQNMCGSFAGRLQLS
jgi:hypothetical protein